MVKSAVIVIAFVILASACSPSESPTTVEGIEPAPTLQVEEIARLLEANLKVRDVYRVRSADHRDGWYVAGRVYGPGAIDGDVAVWFVNEAAGDVAQLLAVDTMADACSFAPFETDAALSWEDAEVQLLEAYVGSRI